MDKIFIPFLFFVLTTVSHAGRVNTVTSADGEGQKTQEQKSKENQQDATQRQEEENSSRVNTKRSFHEDIEASERAEDVKKPLFDD